MEYKRLKPLKSCMLKLHQQALIKYICLNYNIMPDEVKQKIKDLCSECGGEHYKALYRLMVSPDSLRSVSRAENVSEKFLNTSRIKFYYAFYQYIKKQSR